MIRIILVDECRPTSVVMKMLNAGNKSEGTVQSEPDFGGTSILGKGALHGFEVEGLVALEGDAAGVEGQL